MRQVAVIAAGGLLGWAFYQRYADGQALDLLDALATLPQALGELTMTTNERYNAALSNPKNAEIITLLQLSEQRNGVPAGLLVRQAWQESRFNPGAVSPVGAQGLMQFMPATAADYGIDPFDPAQAADAAGRYMATLYRKTGGWKLALAAYNWGIGNVLRKGMGAAPRETRDYVSQIGADAGLV